MYLNEFVFRISSFPLSIDKSCIFVLLLGDFQTLSCIALLLSESNELKQSLRFSFGFFLRLGTGETAARAAGWVRTGTYPMFTLAFAQALSPAPELSHRLSHLLPLWLATRLPMHNHLPCFKSACKTSKIFVFLRPQDHSLHL